MLVLLLLNLENMVAAGITFNWKSGMLKGLRGDPFARGEAFVEQTSVQKLNDEAWTHGHKVCGYPKVCSTVSHCVSLHTHKMLRRSRSTAVKQTCFHSHKLPTSWSYLLAFHFALFVHSTQHKIFANDFPAHFTTVFPRWTSIS